MIDKELQLAYVAGALDGDGSFSLMKKIENKNNSPLYFPMIQLANADESLVDLFINNFGGNKRTRLSYHAKNGSVKKVSYQWKLEKRAKCLPFLETVISYLVVKKERAEFLRDFILDNPFKRGSNRLDNSILFLREKSYIKMRQYNDIPCINGELLSIAKRNDNNDKLFWSYLGGLMDTDGSFSLKREKTNTNPKYTPVISLSMTDCKAIYYIMNNFIGGNLIVVKAKTALNGFCYRFSISKRDIAIKFLEQIIPYLRLKQNAAKILLEFCLNSKRTKYCKAGIAKEELEFRQNCYEKIINLNNYGVYKFPLMDLKPLPDNAEGNKAEGNIATVNVASEETTI